MPVSNLLCMAASAYILYSCSKWIYRKIPALKYIPGIRQRYLRELIKHRRDFIKSVENKWDKFGSLHLKMTEEGLDYSTCLNLIKEYSRLTLENVKNKQFSGTIYPPKLLNENHNDLYMSNGPENLYLEIFRHANLWNGLHDSEFMVTHLLNHQVVSTVADLFGAYPNDVKGLITNGGSQSLMNALRSYINWGKEHKGLEASECIIVAPDTIHAAVIKGCEAYNCQLKLIKTDRNGYVDEDKLYRVVNKYKNYIVALFCSTPSYPYGTIDDVEYFGQLAQVHKLGLHVDCCLGGFIINFLDESYSKLLRISGVTSLSADTHKNGLSPKGSSVLIYKKFPYGENGLYYSIYAIPDWKGGLYGSPKDEGSVSCIETFCALITLLYNGKAKYREIAHNIDLVVKNIKSFLSNDPNVSIISPQDSINVVAFRLTGLSYGATYRLADLMNNKGFVFNCMTDDIIHFCVTARFCENAKDNLNNFYKAFHDSIDQVYEELAAGKKYDGSARLYCSINEALNPTTDRGWLKYFENLLLGREGVTDAIKSHFLALNNPYYNE